MCGAHIWEHPNETSIYTGDRHWAENGVMGWVAGAGASLCQSDKESGSLYRRMARFVRGTRPGPIACREIRRERGTTTRWCACYMDPGGCCHVT